jgi:predicted short-subunit dehydrogenase-like oxidoreductase (DUF2520 family)
MLETSATLYLMAVSDHAIPGLAKELSLPGKLVAHTAGAVSKDVFKGISDHYGVLYPLQSLRKELPVMLEIPILVDGNNTATMATLVDFAKTFSGQVESARDDERLKLHLAAVVVNNFANQLYLLTENFCKKEQVNFNLLLPLIRETALRLQWLSPMNAQTGPAVRNDQETILKHIELLHHYPELLEVYQLLTRNIITANKKVIIK